MEIEIDDVQHLDLEVRIGAVEPVVPTMRLDGRLIKQAPHGQSADGLDNPIEDRRSGQVRGAPVRQRDTVFRWWSCCQGHNLMLLLTGKKLAVVRGEGGP
jgi:hypothetical protein